MPLSRLQRVAGTGRCVWHREVLRDDASFLLRLAMGLVMSPRRHRSSPPTGSCLPIWTRQGRRSTGCRGSSIRLFLCFATGSGLSEADTGDDKKLVGGIFATKAKQVVNEKVQSLRRLSADVRGSSKVDQLYKASVSAANALAVVTADLDRTTASAASRAKRWSRKTAAWCWPQNRRRPRSCK